MDRRAEGRALVRRILRRGDPESRRWAALAAVWVHLAALVAALVVPAPPVRAPEPPPTVVELVVVAAPPPVADAPAAPAPVLRPAPDPTAAPRWPSAPAVEDLPAPPTRARVIVAVSRPGDEDVVDELRRTLGWAPFDRSRLAERTATLSLVGAESTTSSAPAGFVEPDVRWSPAPSLAGTPTGDYVAALEALILAQWSSMDLDVHARAIGIQGDVTVRYRIRRSGQTADVRIVRSSGLPSLDGMAVRAIPARVPRLPPGLGEELHHEITLRYRNP